jgi:oligoribonuclease NrnB/cAMP/cGMP phosphodiesterase (DHH superfamily)
MTWKPDMFIYHSPCDDGFGAAWAVWERWQGAVEYVPATYGKPAPDVTGKHVLIGDFSFKRPVLEAMGATARSIVILDHHKTAEQDLAPWAGWSVEALAAFDGPELACAKMCTETGFPIAAAFDMERSGARMVWDFCHPGKPVPELIRFVEDRDLWRFHYPQTRAFTLWLRSHPYDFAVWSRIAEQLDGIDQPAIILQAMAVEGFYNQKVSEMLQQVQIQRIDGHIVPVVNCSWAFASDVAHELLTRHPDAPFAAVYYDRGDGARTYSLRSEDDRMDVSAIAKRYGGGGHRNAAGFEVPRP